MEHLSVKLTPFIKTAAVGSIAALALSACAQNEAGAPETEETQASSLSGELIGSGASSQGSAQEAWIAGFQGANADVTVNYDPQGSGTGRETFQAGGAAFAGSDRAFKLEEIEAGPFETCAPDSGLVEFPAYISPIAVVFNLEGIESLNMDAATIAGIFSGQITSWNDEAIASQNPDVELPDLAINPVHRADKSGTTENFTDYLAEVAGDAWTPGEAIEEWPADLGGEGAQQTSGMASAVQNGSGTIGYIDASRAEGMGTVAVKVGDEYVEYSPEAAAAVLDASSPEDGRGEHDLAINLDRQTDAAGVYPIVLVSYLIGCEQYADAANAELVKAYFSYIVSEEGQSQAAEAAGSAPISADLRSTIEASIEAIQ